MEIPDDIIKIIVNTTIYKLYVNTDARIRQHLRFLHINKQFNRICDGEERWKDLTLRLVKPLDETIKFNYKNYIIKRAELSELKKYVKKLKKVKNIDSENLRRFTMWNEVRLSSQRKFLKIKKTVKPISHHNRNEDFPFLCNGSAYSYN